MTTPLEATLPAGSTLSVDADEPMTDVATTAAADPVGAPATASLVSAQSAEARVLTADNTPHQSASASPTAALVLEPVQPTTASQPSDQPSVNDSLQPPTAAAAPPLSHLFLLSTPFSVLTHFTDSSGANVDMVSSSSDDEEVQMLPQRANRAGGKAGAAGAGGRAHARRHIVVDDDDKEAGNTEQSATQQRAAVDPEKEEPTDLTKSDNSRHLQLSLAKLCGRLSCLRAGADVHSCFFRRSLGCVT